MSGETGVLTKDAATVQEPAPSREGDAESGWMRVSLLLFLLLAFGLRVYRLSHQSMWWDEMHAGAMSVLPPKAILDNLLAIRNHVPLFFYVLRLWSLLGHTEFTLRFFSVIWGLVSVALIHRLGDMIGGRRVGMVAALLLAVSPFHVWYSQEARMYTLVSACALAANGFLLRLLRRDSWGDLAGYGLCMLAAVYTHYLALFILLAHYAFFSLYYRYVRRAFLRWLACSGIVALLFGVWGAMMMLSGGFARSPIGWIASAHWYEPALTLLTFATGSTIDLAQPLGYLSLVACLTAIAVCLVRVRRQRLPTHLPSAASSASTMRRTVAGMLAIRLLFLWLIVPILLTWLISLDLPIPQKRSIYVDRYLITALPAFLTLVAWGIVSLAASRRWLSYAALAAVLVAAVSALANLYHNPAYERDNWRGAMSSLQMERQFSDIVLLRPSHTLPLAYYTDRSIPYQEFPFLFHPEERKEYLAEKMEPRMADISRDWERAWLISSVDNTNPHGFPHERNAALRRIDKEDAIKAWLDERYVRLEETTFTGVQLTLYDLPHAEAK